MDREVLLRLVVFVDMLFVGDVEIEDQNDRDDHYPLECRSLLE